MLKQWQEKDLQIKYTTMKQTYLHRPNLSVKAEFASENGSDFRYRLEMIKVEANDRPKTVCAIMQNPSYAGIEHADKSVQILERVVFEKRLEEFEGVERLIVVNQFAYIQTNDFVGNDDQIGSRNNTAISEAFEESDIILIAWGKDNGFTERKNYILNLLETMRGKPIFQTSSHPSRMKYDGFIQPFVQA